MSNATDNRTGWPAVLRHGALGAAVVGGVFAAVVLAVLVITWVQMGDADVVNSAEMTALKAKLFDKPGDAELLRQIRQLDRKLRLDYFAQRRRLKLGGWMLLAGAGVLVAGVKTASAIKGYLPHPGPARSLSEIERRTGLAGRWLVGAVAAGSIAAAVAAAILFTPVSLSSDVRYPTFEEIAANWPRFRGPGGSGISAYTNVPATWDAKTGRNILWKSPIPLPGENSPVVWGDRIFCTGATKDRAEVFCYDATDGKLLWRRPIKTASTPTEPPEVMEEDTGYAAPTAVCDGQRVYVVFANGDIACLNFRGAVLWTMSQGLPENMYGHATSLAMYENLLIVQFDQGGDADGGLSEIMGIDGATGKVVWIEGRDVPNSWASPIIARTSSGDQLITNADPWVIAYDPAAGNELWRANLMSGDVAPTPVYSGGMVLVVNAGAVLAAIRPDGTGDVTETHVAWKAEDGLPDITSPLADGQRVWLLDTGGLLTCYRLADGKMLYEKQLDGSFNASPSLAGEKVYLLDQSGRTTILSAADEYKEVGKASLNTRTAQEDDEVDDEGEQGPPEKFNASPAFLDGRIYIRGSKYLYCIGRKEP